MKRVMRIMMTSIFVLVITMNPQAQNYFRGVQTIVQPLQVIIENYTSIQLGKQVSNDPDLNRFDKSNPYCYLQVINDNFGKDYHILFQTGFSGKLIFLAYSNNLSAVFNNAQKPMNVFVNCIRHINEHVSPVQNAEAAVNCIIDRLNYCSN